MALVYGTGEVPQLPKIDFYSPQGVSVEDSQHMVDVLKQYDPNAQYLSNLGAGEGAGTIDTGNVTYDVTKLPVSKYGNYGSFDSYDANKSLLKDPNLWYEDPVYGRITPYTNIKDSSTWLDVVGPLAVTALTMGLGGPMTLGQQFAAQLPKLVGGLATGSGLNLGNVASLAGGAFGLPPEVTMALKLAGNYAGPVFASQQGQQSMNFNPDQQYATEGLGAGGAMTTDQNGGMDWGNILQTILGGAMGGTGFGGLNASSIPAIASALNSYNNSGQYMDMATKYADQMNPFGAQRGYYQDLLKKSYTDPLAFLNDPSHQAIQNREAGALSSRLASSGYLGSGKMSTDMMNYLAQSDMMYLDKERERLGGLAGANIGPAAAAGLIQSGIEGSVKSKNAALAALTQALTVPKDRQLPGMGGGSDVVSTAINAAKQAGVGVTDIVKILKSAGWSTDDILRTIGDYSVSPIDLSSAGMPFGVDPGVADSIGGVLQDPTGTLNGSGVPFVTDLFNPDGSLGDGFNLLFGE